MKKKEASPAQLWIALARCQRAIDGLMQRRVAELGLCSSDYMVLDILLRKGPLTISQIQGRVLLASGSMTAAADRLEKRGLAVRKADQSDRRARVLELTPEGRATVERAMNLQSADLDGIISTLDGDERDDLYRILRRLGRFASEALQQRGAVQKAG
jgi:MarR family 2-MHQ and catechol resistance regulon transcriptional repressor